MWNENEKKPIWQYLALTFAIAWISETLLILGEQLGVISGSAGFAIYFVIVGFGAGFAPAYAIIILLKKHGQIRGLKDLCRRIFKTENILKTVIITAVFFASQLIPNILCNSYLGQPWYFFILLIPMMTIGGGIEEIGWRGFFQPAMEEKLPFAASGLVVGLIWAVWHLPLWLVKIASQSAMNFLSFTCHCIVLAFVIATLYKLTKSVFACVLLHAWCNVLGGGMFSIDTLTNVPNAKLIVIYILEIAASIIVDRVLRHGCHYRIRCHG